VGKFLVNFLAAGLILSASARADMPLSDQDEKQIIGEYSYVGAFSGQEISVVLEFYKDSGNDLKAGGKHRQDSMPEGQWMEEEFHSFRRLSGKEWTNEWKVTKLPGTRCDTDRVCIVAVNESSLNGVKYLPAMRLMQFQPDFSSFQSYTVYKKGESGYLGVILKKTVGVQENISAGSKSADDIESDQSQASLASMQLQIELAFWKSAEQDGDVALYQAYLDKFPEGVFAPIAKLRIQKSKQE